MLHVNSTPVFDQKMGERSWEGQVWRLRRTKCIETYSVQKYMTQEKVVFCEPDLDNCPKDRKERIVELGFKYENLLGH